MNHYLQAVEQVRSQGYVNDATARQLSPADLRRAIEVAGEGA